MTEYNYEGGDDDFSYEISGATAEEFEHADGCDWIYDNCTCGMTDNFIRFKSLCLTYAKIKIAVGIVKYPRLEEFK